MKAFLLVFTLLYSVYGQTYRNWPQWGKDDLHSRLQDSTFHGTLCGTESARGVPSSSQQSVVYNGVHFYVKTGSGTLNGVGLDSAQQWTKDIVYNITGRRGFTLSGPLSLAIVGSPASPEQYLFGFFYVSYPDVPVFGVVFLASRADGNVLWNANVTADVDSEVRGVVVHSSSLVLLSSTTKVEAVSLPFTNGTVSNSTFDKLWTFPLDSRTSRPVVLASGEVAIFSNPTLSVLNPTSGVVLKTASIPEATDLVFATASGAVALSSPSSGVLVSYPSMSITVLNNIRPLAASTTGDFLGFQTTDPARIVLMDEKNSSFTLWTSEPVDLGGNVAASVDPTGIVYVVASSGAYPFQAFQLSSGKLVWKVKQATSVESVSSPIIASAGDSYIVLVDTPTSQQVYSPSCSNTVATCVENVFCQCKGVYHGASCSVACNATVTCSGHGTCAYDGACNCNQHYYTANCGVLCSNDTCINGTCAASGQCSCFPNNYGPSCATYCNSNTTCSGFGKCSDDGGCLCDPGSMFDVRVHGGKNCGEMVVNLSFVAFVIGVIAIGLLCSGIALCCIIEKNTKLERDQFSLLANEDKHHRR